jgi:hypothetical protein
LPKPCSTIADKTDNQVQHSKEETLLPNAILELLPRVSAGTAGEREIISQCLRLFPESLNLKDIGAVDSFTTKVRFIAK